jgi:hypothetical protein
MTTPWSGEAALRPATPEECSTVQGPLVVQGAKELVGFELFANLESLVLNGCEITDLAALAKMPKLQSLRVAGCTLRDISALQAVKTLDELEINFCQVEDLSPLLEMPKLHWLRLFGDPLSDASYDEILPQLREREIPGFHQPPVIEVSPREDWQMCRKIWDAGLKHCYGYVPRSPEATLVLPGCGTLGRAVNFYQYSFDGMAKALENPKFAEYKLFTGVPEIQDWVDQSANRFYVHWLGGGSQDAWEWVGRGVPGPQMQPVREFISHFEYEMFYLESPMLIDAMERKHNVKFPEWFRKIKSQGLAGVRPHLPTVEYRFDQFAKAAITREGGQYKMGYLGYYNDEDRRVFHDRCGMFPIGDITTQVGDSMLAINLRHPEDERIYEFWPRSLHNAVSEKQNPLELMTPVFESWGQMLEAVTAIQVGDEVVEGEIY